MKLRKMISKIALASFAVLAAVTASPYHFFVNAASDDYPDEIQFPITVLDFRRDNLLFEWDTSFDLSLYKNYYGDGLGVGLVEDTLSDDGVPVYKQKTVEKIAEIVQQTLKNSTNTYYNALNQKYPSTGHDTYSDLSLRRYISADIPVLTYYSNSTASVDSIWLPDDPAEAANYRVEKVTDAEWVAKQYVSPDGQRYGDNSNWYKYRYAEVYDDSVSSTTPVYILRADAIIFFYDVGSVSRTFTNLEDVDYTFNYGGIQGSDSLEIKVTDKDGTRIINGGATVHPDTNHEIKITLTLTNTSKTSNGWLTDVNLSNYYQQHGIWSVWLNYAGTEMYPLGDYDESKSKFDNDPNLGWTDIRTCMDYAYFVTSNLFKYNSSLNTQYNDYDNLIFHKVDDNGKVAYEFAAAKNKVMGLIYNKADKTIRNVFGTDTGTKPGDVVKGGGSFFIADEAQREYESIDYLSNGHNYHFTISSHSNFVYKEGADQYFYFYGDDDVYVYVNGHLYLDLGGAHTQLAGSINLDDIAAAHPEWGIESGKVVSLDFFYMERHTTESNFYSMMNFKLATDEVGFGLPYDSIPYGYLVDLDYSLTTLRELNTNKNITFTDNFGNIIGAEGFELADGISLKDNKLTVTVTDESGTKDETRSREFEFVDPNHPTAAEVAAVTDYFKSLEMVQGETVTVTGPQYDTSFKPYDEYETVTGESENTKSLTFVTEVTYDAWMEGAFEPTEGKLTKNTPVKILVGSIKVCAAQENNEKKELADYGAFTVDRDTDGESINARAYHYDNDPSVTGITETTLEKLARGSYTLKLDPDVLTSYKVYINDEEVTELTIDFEPEYDSENKTWIYPDVKFELRAKRLAPDLKDLT